jgi:chorismate lyase/3-hydroxybenzoate synthase
VLRVRTGKFDDRLPDDALCCFRFGPNSLAAPDPRIVPVDMLPLDAQLDSELWLGAERAEYGAADGFNFAHDSQTLFVSRVLPPEQCQNLARVTSTQYLRMDALLRRLGFPHWHRMWNYLARINEGGGDDERYRQFNSGRYAAVALRSADLTTLPAASGVGSGGNNLVLACIAGREPARQIENPRQVPAFHYPREYGPHAPMFSRAALVRNSAGAQLLVSGTASIVGHRSLHAGDTAAQLAETLANFRALLTAAGIAAQVPESLKVYLRDSADLPLVRDALERAMPSQQSVLYLQADICRRELLLEIEGTCQLPRAL